MGVSKNRGGPPKWMVKIMENPIKMDDLGVPLFWKHPHLHLVHPLQVYDLNLKTNPCWLVDDIANSISETNSKKTSIPTKT